MGWAKKWSHPKKSVFTDADSSRVSIAICDSVCPHDKTKRLKQKSPNLAQPHRDSLSRYVAHQLISGQRSRCWRWQGHKVHKVATRQPCGTVSLQLLGCVRHGCLVARQHFEHNRAGLSYWRRSNGRLCTLSSAQNLVWVVYSMNVCRWIVDNFICR